jgi:hypothetical protein
MTKDEELLELVKLRRMSPDEIEADRQAALESVGFDSKTGLKSLEVVALVDAVFNLLIPRMEESDAELPCMPKDFAAKRGRERISLDEYFSELEQLGLQREQIQAFADEKANLHKARSAETKTKAKRLFDLLMDSPFVLEEELRELVDSSSIYEFMGLVLENANSARARVNAQKRHASSRDSKAKVFEWCDENMHRFSSMDDAAFDIAESFIPEKFRAVRDWMTEWKKLRSASKP